MKVHVEMLLAGRSVKEANNIFLNHMLQYQHSHSSDQLHGAGPSWEADSSSDIKKIPVCYGLRNLLTCLQGSTVSLYLEADESGFCPRNLFVLMYKYLSPVCA